MVCKAWAAQFRSPAFHSLRGALQLAEPWVYVRARSKSVGRSGRSKWTALDVLTARWHSVQSPPSEMQTRALGAGCTVAGGCLYICAGVTSDFGLEVESPLGVLYRYDPRENKWRQLRSLREARANLAFGAVGNCLIAAAGVRHFHELRSVERYHLGRPEHATGQPSCAAAVPPGRAGATWQSLGPEVQEAEEGSWARSRSHSHNQSQMRIDSGAAEPISQIYGNADDVTAGLCPDRATLRTRVTTSDSAALLPGDSAAAHARHGAALAEDASWQAGAPLPAEISCFDSAVLGSKMYVTEGWSWPFHFSPRGFVYDGDTGAWDLMRLGMSEGWTGVSAVIGARIYTLYGHNGLRRMVCKAWAAQFRSPAFHSLRGALQLAEPWVYVRARSKSVGRSGRSKWTALDVLTARWHSVQSPPSEMQTRALGAGCTVAGGCLYICAGVTSDFGLEVESPLGVLYRYDPRENKWRQLRSLREARANLAFGAVGNCLIAAAGVRHFHELRSVERYHLGRPEHATGQPSCAAAVPPGRAGATWQSLGPEVQEAEEGSWARSRSHSHNQSQMRIDSGAAEPISQIYGNADDVTAGLCPDRATLRTRVTTSDSAALLPGDSAAAHARHGAALAEDASWQAGAPLPAEISCFDSAVLGSKMYVTEGWSWPFHFSPRGFVYDGDTGAWDLMRLGMSEGWTGVSAVIGARIYTLYGHNGLRRLSTYDWELDKWHLLKGQPMPIEVEPPIVAAAVDGRIYYIGKNLSTAVATLTPAPGGGAKEEVTWSMIAPSFIGRDLLPGNCAVLAV
eukprot:jgi/Mesen1/9827/ME000007S09880